MVTENKRYPGGIPETTTIPTDGGMLVYFDDQTTPVQRITQANIYAEIDARITNAGGGGGWRRRSDR